MQARFARRVSGDTGDTVLSLRQARDTPPLDLVHTAAPLPSVHDMFTICLQRLGWAPVGRLGAAHARNICSHVRNTLVLTNPRTQVALHESRSNRAAHGTDMRVPPGVLACS